MTGTRNEAHAASLVLAAAMLIALAIPAGAASSTSAKQWANGVCSAIQTFANSVDSTISSLKGSDSLDEREPGSEERAAVHGDGPPGLAREPRQAVDQ